MTLSTMNIARLMRDFADHRTSPSALVEACLAAARAPDGEGARVYTELFADEAVRAARGADVRVQEGGAAVRALEGIPVSVKDLFDLEGSPTRAASVALSEPPAAAADAPAVARLRAAGAIVIGKTNMTEFAYSGVGINPHFGTPLNPYERHVRRIPGGSSSGAAVSVSDHMASAALGTDTGGSVRVPAALCGLVGWKPTAARVPREGVFPLSRSLDSVGPIAADVASCARLDAVLSGIRAFGADDEGASGPLEGLSGTRFAFPSRVLAEDADPHVARSIERALKTLSRAGAVIVEMPLAEISDVPATGLGPVILGSEAYAGHRINLARNGSKYDPRVRARLELGAAFRAFEYLDALEGRAQSIAAVRRALAGFDGWLMPTTPMIAPPLASFALDEEFFRINKQLLRNSAIVNFLDGCAISLPCHAPGEAPVGLTFAGTTLTDAHVLAVAARIEDALAKTPRG